MVETISVKVLPLETLFISARPPQTRDSSGCASNTGKHGEEPERVLVLEFNDLVTYTRGDFTGLSKNSGQRGGFFT
jgi:hypothetical protein